MLERDADFQSKELNVNSLVEHPSDVEGLVRWQQIVKVVEALIVLAEGDITVTRRVTGALLECLTLPHRLLEQLEACVDGVIAGDPVASAQLAQRLHVLVQGATALRGSHKNLAAELDRLSALSTDEDEQDKNEQSLSFLSLTRLGMAATIATMQHGVDSLDSVLDLVLGLALGTASTNRLLRGLATHGAAGVAEALHQLRLFGAFPVPLPTMRTMGAMPGLTPVGVPGGMPGGGPSGIPGLPKGSGNIPELAEELVARLRNPGRWNPEEWDHAPDWREIVGFPKPEMIDVGEINRIRCLLVLINALKLREEPPPPRQGRVVWADSITSVTASGACPGDQLVLRGGDFGSPSADRGVMLPLLEGCRAFAVPAENWTPTSITVILPPTIASGTVGLVDLSYVRVYNEWANRMNELMQQIIKNAKCSGSKVPDIQLINPFDECAPQTPVNWLRAGIPLIRSFQINGRTTPPPAVINPGASVTLSWSLRNVESFALRRTSNVGPLLAGAAELISPPGTSYALGPYHSQRAELATYEIEANGSCGSAKAQVQVRVSKVPQLQFRGIEVTQGIQSFGDPSTPDNSLPLVAQKDTIVRVYVTVDNLAGFAPAGLSDRASVSGELMIVGTTLKLAPLNTSILAGPFSMLKRSSSESSLNFRIPASLSTDTLSVRARIWTSDEYEVPPTGEKTRPEASTMHTITWVKKAPFKVRYVRVSSPASGLPDDATARNALLRAFDLLATPATDIAPARLATWHTSANVATKDGLSTLLSHLDDQHDCTLSEALFPWEDECPDADGAVWIGLFGGGSGGLAQGYRPFGTSRNTAVAPLYDRTTIAHELGHTLKLNHVNPNQHCGIEPDGDFDTLPNGGAIVSGDAFDPSAGQPVTLPLLFDFMSYACFRWVSRSNWRRVFDKF